VLDTAAGGGAIGGVAEIGQKRRPLLTAQEVKEFLIAYVACFMAVSAWIS